MPLNKEELNNLIKGYKTNFPLESSDTVETIRTKTIAMLQELDSSGAITDYSGVNVRDDGNHFRVSIDVTTDDGYPIRAKIRMNKL